MSMRATLLVVILTAITLVTTNSSAHSLYGESLCSLPDYYCITVKSGDTWDSLFNNLQERDLLRRLNRMNVRLRSGMVIAIPKQLDKLTIYDIAPFPRYIKAPNEKIIYVSQRNLAWAAYDETGQLVWWGPISSGSQTCPHILGGCSTPTGYFRIIRKQDIDCISTVFPRRAQGDSGGAQMPFCMHFYRGFALHGSEEVPGWRASHGCIRLFTEDARWLNQEFIQLPGAGIQGTRIVIDA